MKEVKQLQSVLKFNKVRIVNKCFQYSDDQVAIIGEKLEIALINYKGTKGTLYEISSNGSFIDLGTIEDDDIDFIKKKVFDNWTGYQAISDDFRQSIKLSLPFIGNDELRPIMSGLYLGTDYRTAATDAHALHLDKHNLNIKKDVVIPSNILKLPFDEIAFNDNYTRSIVRYGDVTVIFNNIEGKYPDFDAVIPQRDYYTKCVTFSSQDIKEMYDVAHTVNKETNAVYIKDNEVCVIKENSKSTINTVKIQEVKGGAEQVTILMPTMIDKDDTFNLDFGFNTKFLKNITPSGHSVKMYWYDTKKALRLEFIPEKTPTKKAPTKKVVQSDNSDLILELKKQIEELKKENELLKSKTVEIDQSIADIDRDLEIVVYSDRCLALFGEYTKERKDYIKNTLKGLFNTRLKYNNGVRAGWIVSNKYSKLVEAL